MNNAGKTFTTFSLMKDYTGQAVCECGHTTDKRDFAADKAVDPVALGGVRKDTIGMLAERNTAKMSADYKASLEKKYNEDYKKKKKKTP